MAYTSSARNNDVGLDMVGHYIDPIALKVDENHATIAIHLCARHALAQVTRLICSYMVTYLAATSRQVRTGKV